MQCYNAELGNLNYQTALPRFILVIGQLCSNDRKVKSILLAKIIHGPRTFENFNVLLPEFATRYVLQFLH